MRFVMKTWIAVLTLPLTLSSVSYGQAAPTAVASTGTRTSLSPLDGVVHYALNASEMVEIGEYNSGQVSNAASISGDVAYESKSQVKPFTLLYAGGVLFSNQYGYGTTTFQNLAISQGLVTKNWVLGVSDSVSYLPQSPTTGLSGIPGVGDIGAVPIEGSPAQGPAGGVLSYASDRVGNSLGGSVERRLTPNTSISGLASWSILRFVNGDGIDTSQVSAQGGLNHRIDARDSVSGNVTYSTYTYDSAGNDFQTRGFTGAFQRALSRTLTMDVSAGPEWITSSQSELIPSRVLVAASAGLTYQRRYTNARVNFSRGVNGGSGIQPGALSNSVNAAAGRTWGRDWVAAGSATYTYTSGLVASTAPTTVPGATTTPVITTGTSKTFYGGVQVTRRLSNYLAAFASYTAQDQSITGSLAQQNAFSGLAQTFGIGISFTPKSTRLGQF
jgi:hypothetical protein